tara:strand:- start:495 stop:1019 length:525 start_codon:yes stop_codon:yes gene_type:complete
MSKKSKKRNKIKNNKTRAKGKGLTSNLRETKFLINNLSYDGKNLPPDVSKLITRNYSKNLINSRINEIRKKKILLEKLNRYKEIVHDIHLNYPPESLYDSGFDYLSDKNIINNIIKKVKNLHRENITDLEMIKIDNELEPIWSEINQLFESEMENPYRVLDLDLLEGFLFPSVP